MIDINMLRKILFIWTLGFIAIVPSLNSYPDIFVSQGCTSFYASQGDFALFGRNLDWFSDWAIPESTIRLLPADVGKYGRICFLTIVSYDPMAIGERIL